MTPFTVSIECDYEGFWRYNYVVMGSVMCAGEEVDFIKHRSEVAPVGAELREMPLGYSNERGVKLVSKEGDKLTLYIYVIPHTLPSTDSTADAEVFNMSLVVSHGSKVILKRQLEINPWSGDNIELRLNSEGLTKSEL